jgi:hypothetical protein
MKTYPPKKRTTHPGTHLRGKKEEPSSIITNAGALDCLALTQHFYNGLGFQ